MPSEIASDLSISLVARLIRARGVKYGAGPYLIRLDDLCRYADELAYSREDVMRVLEDAASLQMLMFDAAQVEMPEKKMEYVLNPLADEPQIMGFEATDEGIGMSIAHPGASVIAAAFVHSFREACAENYVEMSFRDPTTHEDFTVTVQRVAGATPHGKRTEAEAETERVRQVAAEAITYLRALGHTEAAEKLSSQLG